MPWLSEWWNQISGVFTQGFQITIIGMALVFLTLGLVIVAMLLLTKLPWLQAKEQGGEGESCTLQIVSAELAAEPPAAQDDELERVAAVAVAILRGRRKSIRLARRQRTPSKWKSYGRADQLGL